jgi:hypothetical protein
MKRSFQVSNSRSFTVFGRWTQITIHDATDNHNQKSDDDSSLLRGTRPAKKKKWCHFHLKPSTKIDAIKFMLWKWNKNTFNSESLVYFRAKSSHSSAILQCFLFRARICAAALSLRAASMSVVTQHVYGCWDQAKSMMTTTVLGWGCLTLGCIPKLRFE